MVPESPPLFGRSVSALRKRGFVRFQKSQIGRLELSQFRHFGGFDQGHPRLALGNPAAVLFGRDVIGPILAHHIRIEKVLEMRGEIVDLAPLHFAIHVPIRMHGEVNPAGFIAQPGERVGAKAGVHRIGIFATDELQIECISGRSVSGP